jgi:hypothetical protein
MVGHDECKKSLFVFVRVHWYSKRLTTTLLSIDAVGTFDAPDIAANQYNFLPTPGNSEAQEYSSLPI